ncbi:MAG: serine aminopeptidase domain-containing protein, partial [Flavisolibacter sp.]
SDYAKKLNVPVMIQCGTKDMYMGEEELQKMYGRIPSLQKQLVIYQGASHSSLLDADSVKWQNGVHRFLQSLP